MSDKSAIQWTDATWNPTRGCSLVSAGCTNCYAMRQAHRFSGKGKAYEGLTRSSSNGPLWTGDVRLIEDKLDEPLRWKEPKRIFVNSMSDLFHEGLRDEDIDKVFSIMAEDYDMHWTEEEGNVRQPHHIFQVLTKRPARMYEYVSRLRQLNESAVANWFELPLVKLAVARAQNRGNPFAGNMSIPVVQWVADGMPSLWLGVSVEDQKTADVRIPWLLKTPAAVRWVSYEPALGPVDFTEATYDAECPDCKGQREITDPAHELHPLNTGDGEDETWCPTCTDAGERKLWGLDWIIVGGESGPGARPFDLQWARDTIAQCKAAGVPCFIKQLGRYVMGDPAEFPMRDNEWVDPDGDFQGPVLRDKKGGDMQEWPDDLRVREYPKGT